MISFASAWDRDNCGQYDKNSKTMKIKNNCLLGIDWFAEDMADITLTDGVKYENTNGHLKTLVPAGDEVLFAEIYINSKQDFKEAIKGMKYYNRKDNMKELSRKIVYKKKVVTYEEQQPVYSQVCEDDLKNGYTNSTNKTITYTQICSKELTGYKDAEEVITWEDVNQKDFKVGGQTLGLFTKVEVGDHIEWIPEYLGIKVKEWATFQQSTAVGLESYYRMDNSDNVVLDKIIEKHLTNGGATKGVTGIINNGFDFEAGDSDYLTSSTWMNGKTITDMTTSIWFKQESDISYMKFFEFGGANDNRFSMQTDTGTGNTICIFEEVGGHDTASCGSTDITDGEWHMATMVYDGSNVVNLYLDGYNLEATDNSVGNPSDVGDALFIGSDTGTTSNYDGILDEFGIWSRLLTESEINELYNSGTGLQNPRNNNNWEDNNLDTGLISYYKLDGTTGAVIDEKGENNGVDYHTTRGVTGILETAFDFENSEADFVLLPDKTEYDNINDISFSFWVKPETTTQGHMLFRKRIPGGSTAYSIEWGAANKLRATFIADSGSSTIDSSSVVATGEWTMITLTYNNGDLNMYLNGVNDGFNSGGSGDLVDVAGDIALGCNLQGSTSCYAGSSHDGIIDEFGIWSIELNDTQIQGLFNYTSSLVYGSSGTPADPAPVVTLNSPDDTFNFTTDSVTFNIDATDNNEIANVSLYINSVLNETNTSQVNGTYIFPRSIIDGDHNWFIIATDNESQSTQSATRTFNVNTTPFIEFLTPPTLENYANVSQSYVPMKVNVSTALFQNITYSLRNINGTNFTQFFETETYDINFTGVADGHYHYDVTICTTTNQCNITETRHINHDVTAPVITITAPTGILDYIFVGDNETLNWTLTDDAGNLDSCWYEYNSVNTSVNCSLNTTSFVYIFEEDSLTFYSNDTFGNVGFNTTTWDYKVTEVSQTFSPETKAGTLEDYTLELVLGSGVDLTDASLKYNGETISTTITSDGQSRTVAVLDNEVILYEVNTNVTFYWDLTLADSTEINTSSNIQLVQAIFLDNCSVYTFELFNISLFDERTKGSITGDIELNFDLLNVPSYNVIDNIKLDLESVSTSMVCSDTNLTTDNLAYSLEMRYLSDGYEAELYHIQRSLIDDSPDVIDLFDLNSSHSTEFKITYQDDTFTFVEGAVVQLQRKYIAEDAYEVVEAPLTSREGTTVVHADLDSNKYRATIVKNGVVLDIFDNIVFNCESELTGECTLKLLGAVNPQNDILYDTQRDMAYTLPTLNTSTDVIEIEFIIPSGTPATMNFIMRQRDQFGNQTLCNKTLTSSAGSLECQFSRTIGDSYLDISIYKDGEIMAMSSYKIAEASGVDFLGNNYIIVVVLLLSMVGMALTSPEWTVLIAVVSLFLAGGLWLINGVDFVMGLGMLGWLFIAAIILIFKMSKQEDR